MQKGAAGIRAQNRPGPQRNRPESKSTPDDTPVVVERWDSDAEDDENTEEPNTDVEDANVNAVGVASLNDW